jgi:hypothetical protein
MQVFRNWPRGQFAADLDAGAALPAHSPMIESRGHASSYAAKLTDSRRSENDAGAERRPGISAGSGNNAVMMTEPGSVSPQHVLDGIWER